MVCKPAKRFAQLPGEGSRYGKIETAIVDYKKSGRPFIRIMGADVPLWGNVNRAMNTCLAQVAEEGWDYYLGNTDWPQQYVEAVSDFEKRLRGAEFLPSNIIAIPGSASGYRLLLNAMLDPADEIVVVEPAHCAGVPFSFMWYIGAKVIQSPCVESEGWEPDLDKLRANVTERTKAIFMDYPNNPTGAIYSEKSRKAIVDIAGEHDIPIVSDEIYGTIVFDGNEAQSMASIAADVPVIVLSSFSKFFAHPGWRIGYVCFHDPTGKIKELTDVCKRVASSYGHSTTNIPLPIMVAATRTLREYTSSIKDTAARSLLVKGAVAETKTMLRRLQAARDYTSERIAEMEGISVVNAKATMYMFPRVEQVGRTWKSDEDFMLELVKEEGLAFDFGVGRFGNTSYGHFRTMLLPDIPALGEIWNRVERFLTRHSK